MGISFKVKGIDQLLKELELDNREMKQASLKIKHDLANLILKGAKDRVPVLTGTLKGRIFKVVNKHNVEVVADTDYAQFVEFGSVHNKPKPYMTPAVEQAERELEKIAERHLGKLFK